MCIWYTLSAGVPDLVIVLILKIRLQEYQRENDNRHHQGSILSGFVISKTSNPSRKWLL